MTIAICISDPKNSLTGQAHIVTIENNEIVDVQKENIYLKDENFLSLWVHNNHIEVLYMDNVPTKVKMFCRNWHVDVCDLSEVEATPILRKLFSEISI